MTHNFASLPLAREYEKQGYIDDALEIYRAMDTDQNPDAQEIRDAISRLDTQKHAGAAQDLNGPDTDISGPTRTKETRVVHLLDTWLRWVVLQKRVEILKNIKARL
ncbi:MAG: hypothetical protein CSA25_02530 [Desulfobacter postgatei]|uniref:Uncharacterized protein n=1 Tax=Desulfobacter postgatei TaxID=2293 RepID=A0A2G6MSG2_9BACT|nr:MAG: hypothetical protein CSA25_02530 [Desulfobacter postgatei]